MEAGRCTPQVRAGGRAPTTGLSCEHSEHMWAQAPCPPRPVLPTPGRCMGTLHVLGPSIAPTLQMSKWRPSEAAKLPATQHGRGGQGFSPCTGPLETLIHRRIICMLSL